MDNNMTPETPKAPKQIKKAPIIIAAIAVLVVVIGFIFGPKIVNAARKLFLSDSKYAAHVVESSIEDTFDTVKQTTETYIEYAEKGVTADLEVTLALEKGGKELISDLGAVDEEYYEWFDSASIALDAAVNPEKLELAYGIAGQLNKKDIASMEIALVDNTAYISIPDYNKKAISYELPEYVLPEIPDIDLSPIVKALDLDLIENIALNYTSVALSAIEATEDTVTLEAGNAKAKLTESTIVIDAALAKDVATAVLEEASKDKDLKKFCQMIVDLAKAAEKAELLELLEDATGETIDPDDFDADDMYEAITEAVDYALEEVEAMDAEAFGDAALEISVYSDAEGDFAGMKISTISGEEESVYFEVYYVTSGSKAGFELTAYSPSYSYNEETGDFDIEVEETFSIVGEGKESGDKLTAEFTITSYGEEVYTFETKNLDLKKLGDGFLVGELIFPIPDVPMLEDAAISLISNCDSNDKVDLKLALLDDKDELASITVKGSIKAGAKVKAPGSAIDGTDEDELMEWAEKTVEAVIKELPKKLKSAKLPEEFLELVEEALEEMENDLL